MAGAARLNHPAPLLAVEDLAIGFAQRRSVLRVVDGVSFSVAAGETLAIVGESGSGKSVTSLAIMGLLPEDSARILGGTITLAGAAGAIDLLRQKPEARRLLRGSAMAMIFQEPMTSLNPVFTVGAQIAEAVALHRGASARAAHAAAVAALEEVGIPDPARRADTYPHELSGGLRQRAMIAMALACRPQLLIADEPTTALDVTIQAQILDLLRRIQAENGLSILFITHDLGVVAEMADRVAVMYAGQVVESGRVADVLEHPLHPYTRGLLASVPELGCSWRGRRKLTPIPGTPPDPAHPAPGCRFAPRCAHAAAMCTEQAPMLDHAAPHAVRCLRWQALAA